MVFTVLAAADVGGDKHNLELQFPVQPSRAELESMIASTYSSQFPGTSFNISRLQLYDETMQRWVDLGPNTPLRDFCQVYAFNRGAVEVQKPIPPPRKPFHPPMPDNATHDEKTRAVFEELDVNNNRVIEPEEFKRGFRVLNFDLSPATVMDLFGKADANKDGVISLSEWQRFTEMYPTMLDSLYFRSRDYWEDFRQKQNIKAARDDLEAKKGQEKQVHLSHLEAQQATNNQEKRLTAAELGLAEAVEEEREAKRRLLDGQRETEDLMRERGQRMQDLELAKEKERQRTLAHAEAQRETDRAEQALAWQEAEQAKAQDKERQAANVALEAQRETERARRIEAEAAADLQAAREREQQANLVLLEEKRQTELAMDRLKQAELELQQRVGREKEMGLRSKEAAAITERERVKRDEDERALQLARDQEQQCHLRHMEAQRAVEDHERKVLALEAERQAALQRRRQIEDQEKPLLEQEVRLREQRESLEEKEAKLRTEASHFHGSRPTHRSPFRGGSEIRARPGSAR